MSRANPGPLVTDTFLIGRWLALRTFGIVYLFAFLSFGDQIVGLIGEQGLVPAADSLAQHRAASGGWAWLRAPSIFWLTTDETVLQVSLWLGLGAAVLLTLNLVPRLALLAAWMLYLSLASLQPPGPLGVLFDFPPDHMILEGSLIAMFLAPGGIRPGLGHRTRLPPWVRLLFYVLLFKVMFGSGIAKLVNGQDIWWDCTALYFDLETRPGPTPLAASLRESPMWVLVGGTLFMFVVELLVPWFYFVAGRPRRLAGWLTLALMVGIMLTGNYRWFPLTTFGVAMLLIDDRTWWGLLARVGVHPTEPAPVAATVDRWPRLRSCAAAILTGVLIVVGGCQTLDSCVPDGRRPQLLSAVRAWLRPYHVSHGYQLFGRVRKEHQVVVFEGSDDGVQWREFDNRLSPGALDRPCRFVAPYHYSLDFLMWLSGDVPWHARPGWLKRLMHGLLTGNAPTYDLFRSTPWQPDKPPKFMRGRLYVYRYADAATRARGQWWTREARGAWCPTTTLRDGALALVNPADPGVSRRR